MAAAPTYATFAVRQVVGPHYNIAATHIEWPDTIRIEGIHLASQQPGKASVQRGSIRLSRFDWRAKTVWIRVRLEEPAIRLTRRDAMPVLAPPLPFAGLSASGAKLPVQVWPRWFADWIASWHVQVETIDLAEGALEWVDELASGTFRGILHHLFVTLTPPIGGLRGEPLSFAARGEIVGAGGHSAPLYCSGWLDLPGRDIEASCRLEPIAVAAFSPYYERSGRVKVNLYSTTIAGTTRWQAQANQLNGRFQIRLDHLTHGDLSVRGRTILSLPQLTKDTDGKLISEIRVVGLLDTPESWRWECLPGTDLVQQHIRSRFDKANQVISFKLLGQRFGLVLVPVSQDFVKTIQQASDEIEAALEVVSSPFLDEIRRQVIEPPRTPDVELSPSAVPDVSVPIPGAETALPVEHDPAPAR